MDFNHTLRVLVVREDAMWCAMALDMSLRGYGKTQAEAVEKLTEAVEAQISFAVQHDTPPPVLAVKSKMHLLLRCSLAPGFPVLIPSKKIPTCL